ncbi:MAG: LytTR family DNA-binding domain-containing protein [Acidobacteriota bacterium]|nr:LytTR family DNA-binding domain-containing protein [Acidobacteriota bacterium]
MKAFLVDDEELAIRRLRRLLEERGVEILGSAQDPVEAIARIEETRAAVLFLDIQMPGLNGFEMLERLHSDPLVVFTTAYDQYALQAFAVNSIDYLLKPVEAAPLDRALAKVERFLAGSEPRPDLRKLLAELTRAGSSPAQAFPERISSRTGDRIEFLTLSQITHFFAKEKLTFAATEQKDYCVDYTLDELERKLDPAQFVRVHRAAVVNLAWVHELHAWFGGKMMARLKDANRTDIGVSRERVRELKERLGI